MPSGMALPLIIPFRTSFCFADVAENEKAEVLGYCVYNFAVFGSSFCSLRNQCCFRSCTKLASALGQTVQNHLFP